VLNDPHLSVIARKWIADTRNTVYFSAASAWEISIKAQAGKLPLPDTPDRFLAQQCVQNGFVLLPITQQHCVQTYHLSLLHRDPFDRILVAQCQVEALAILSADSLVAQYPVTVIW
jgi:PIN domain nuclease of toxin-antitoxin system